ncbi:MAG: HAD family phosphatase [Lachnospiraceae bacterium]|nr:HAD family phosphatase [Lachnospiraceae bacterium]
MIKAVIFDMDGTILDTESIFVPAWQEAAHMCGVKDFKEEHALMLRSLARPFAKKQMEEIFGEDFPLDEIRATRKKLMDAYIKKHGILAKPGVEETIVDLKNKGYKIGIATAGSFERSKSYLTTAGIWDCFDENMIICATELAHGKPYPDVYLYACEKLGEKPENCIAVEDAPNGILAAYRAGTKVIMIPDMTQPDEELAKLLYKKLDCLADLMNILE